MVLQPSSEVHWAADVAEPSEDLAIAGRSFWQIAWRRLRQDRVAMAGGLAVVLILLVAIFASQLIQLYGHPPSEFNSKLTSIDTTMPTGRFGGISSSHWLGVEPVNGRDVLSRLIAGSRTSLIIALPTTLISLLLGCLTGMISAYYCGVLDTVVGSIFEVLLTLPGLLLALTLVSILSQSPGLAGLHGESLNVVLVIAVLGFFGFPYLGRIVRGQVLSLREEEFVLAARSLGASDLRIMMRELLPNMLGPLLVWTTLAVPANILAESSMSYLGIGVQAPTASWGNMLSSAQNWFEVDPMGLFLPGIALFVTVLSFNVFGDGLRDALDPKSTQ